MWQAGSRGAIANLADVVQVYFCTCIFPSQVTAILKPSASWFLTDTSHSRQNSYLDLIEFSSLHIVLLCPILDFLGTLCSPSPVLSISYTSPERYICFSASATHKHCKVFREGCLVEVTG
jgi:hypothetical protein